MPWSEWKSNGLWPPFKMASSDARPLRCETGIETCSVTGGDDGKQRDHAPGSFRLSRACLPARRPPDPGGESGLSASAFDFGIFPEREDWDRFPSWQEIFDAYPLPDSPAYHTFRARFGWPPVARGTCGLPPPWRVQDLREGRPDEEWAAAALRRLISVPADWATVVFPRRCQERRHGSRPRSCRRLPWRS